MATLLVTAKMSPELAARIEDSVRGTRASRGRRHGAVLAPRHVFFLRLGLAAFTAAVVVSFAMFHRRAELELDGVRASLLGTVRDRGASLAVEDRQAVARAESWLLRASSVYEGDLVADELRAPGALASTLTRPMVYVRGSIEDFTASGRIVDAASTSAKDSLLLCLLDPPASGAEKTLLPRVRTAYSNAALLDERTANVHRLYAAEIGLPVLLPAWSERVRSARESWELTRLRKELDSAPLDEAKRAASADLLLFAMDERGDGSGPTEIDGERPHEVRVGIVDLRSGKVLLRQRKRADPAWISPATRSQYAAGLDACRLALDVRNAVVSGE
jgi:hypothetical protein